MQNLDRPCRRLIAAQCLPGRAGQPTQIQLVMTLDQLTRLDGDAGDGWTGPGPTAGPGDDCDASITPIVTGHVDHDLLDRLAANLLHPQPGHRGQASTPPQAGHPAQASAGDPNGAGVAGQSAAAARPGPAAVRDLILRNAVALLSGPAGLAAQLRTARLTGPAASASLPSDVGAAADTIPAHLRRAVITRDRHCAFPGGCDQPPAACQVHHTSPAARAGRPR